MARTWINAAGEPNMSHRGREYRSAVRCGNGHVYVAMLTEEWGGCWADRGCPKCDSDRWDFVDEEIEEDPDDA